MTKTVHTVTLPDGTTDKRTSASRVYPFVLVGRHDAAEDRARAQAGWARRDAGNNWDYARHCASVAPGSVYPEPGFKFTVDQKMHDDGKAVIAQFPTREDYVAAKKAEALAKIAEQEAAGYYEKWHALTWSSRADLAEKAKSQFQSYRDLRVMETQYVTK